MSQDVLLSVLNSSTLCDTSVNMEMQRSESCDKCFNLNVELSKSQYDYKELLKSYSQLEKHCISHELSIQLNQYIFQKDNSCDNQNALEIPEYFENNDLKAHLQDKDTTICKLKKLIKSLRENNKEEKVNHDITKLETINEELENSVAKLLSENELLWKEIVENVAQIPIAATIVLGMFKLDLDPLAPRGIVEQAKAKQHLDNALNFACKHAKRIQELLFYVRDTCPNAYKPSEKLIAVTPMNKVKKVRFSEPLTSTRNIKQVESSKTSDSNTPVFSSTGLKCSTSTCRSQPARNKRNDRISQSPSSNMKNKVKAQPRKVNKKNRVKEPVCNANVRHTMLNANS
ncbi:hypothetical protein Tco_0790478 [Tanacetum coccineum]